jgi:hypothetical protein
LSSASIVFTRSKGRTNIAARRAVLSFGRLRAGQIQPFADIDRGFGSSRRSYQSFAIDDGPRAPRLLAKTSGLFGKPRLQGSSLLEAAPL